MSVKVNVSIFLDDDLEYLLNHVVKLGKELKRQDLETIEIASNNIMNLSMLSGVPFSQLVSTFTNQLEEQLADINYE